MVIKEVQKSEPDFEEDVEVDDLFEDLIATDPTK